MEYDRYKDHNKLYVLGIISLILCLGFLFLSLYILPFLIWHLHYEVPEFITILHTFFEDTQNFSSSMSAFLVWLIFFIPALITGIVSYYVSNYIDNDLLDIPQQDEFSDNQHSVDVKQDLKESASFGLRILLLMVAVVVGILLLQSIIEYI